MKSLIRKARTMIQRSRLRRLMPGNNQKSCLANFQKRSLGKNLNNYQVNSQSRQHQGSNLKLKMLFERSLLKEKQANQFRKSNKKKKSNYPSLQRKILKIRAVLLR